MKTIKGSDYIEIDIDFEEPLVLQYRATLNWDDSRESYVVGQIKLFLTHATEDTVFFPAEAMLPPSLITYATEMAVESLVSYGHLPE